MALNMDMVFPISVSEEVDIPGEEVVEEPGVGDGEAAGEEEDLAGGQHGFLLMDLMLLLQSPMLIRRNVELNI